MKNISEYEFVNVMATDEYGFSYEGAKALFNYLEDMEQDCDTDVDFDPIAFRCEYSEYDSFEDLQQDYSEIETMEDLEDKITVIPIPGSEGIIIQQY